MLAGEEMKINFGSGKDYRKDWINIDITPDYNPDILIKPNQTSLPFKDNSVNYILSDNVFEHIEPNQLRKLILEFHRILIEEGKLEVYTPHFTGIFTKYLDHIKCYGINSFSEFRDYFDIKQKLLLVNRGKNTKFKKLQFLNIFNFLFNINDTWKQICEKLWIFGFEEVHYIFTKKVKKDDKKIIISTNGEGGQKFQCFTI